MATQKKTHVDPKKVLIVFGVFLSIVVLLSVFSVTDVTKIYTYNIHGVESGYISSLTEAFSKHESRKRFGIVRTDTVITYHRGDIVLDVLNALPNTKKVTVQATSLHDISVDVESYVPVFRAPDGYAITKDGVLYKEIHEHNELPLFVFASSSMVNAQTISYALDISSKISKTLFPVTAMYLDENGDMFFRVENEGSEIRTTLHESSAEAWSTLLSAMDTDPLKELLSTKKASLLYLDIRFGNKVFYKFTNGGGSSIIDGHQTQHATTSSSTPFVQ